MLAPMVEITDPVFRYLCSKYKADYTYTEMISSNAIINGNIISKELCISIDRSPYAVQVFGNDFNILHKSLSIIEEEFKPTSLDINMGCPSKKIINSGAGSSLIKKDPEELYKQFKDLNSTLKTPITVKIRILNNIKKTLCLVDKLEKSGIEAIVIHGRTSEMKYSGNVNIDAITQIKSNLSIPIIGNGDIRTFKEAKDMLEKTNCDGLMIGRAAIGNPSIFNIIKSQLQKKRSLNNNLTLDINIIKYKLLEEYFNISTKYNLENIVNFQRHSQYFFKGTTKAKIIRIKINKLNQSEEYKKKDNIEKMEYILNEILKIITI